ncbi:DUF418 domain-containing protein [Salicibibacter cibarius]|uniref:DUF418 domain-containing protein n=1 Tax=Salicibibacter cibarius TaxID=2743000 RepID=A0A7T6Z5D1_9BACI|nr:DUF418 domain-containing protein [Salicibibacter cibarius]QQK77106.1 DUF418 domain-containing protein [Salicibibacter cibarius]
MKNNKMNAADYSERSLAPDISRGFMLLLIAMAYAPTYLFNIETGVYTRPAGGTLLDQTVNFLSLLFLDSRAYPMFAVLFGMGLAIVVNRQMEKGMGETDIKKLIRRRGLFLLLFGVVHGTFVYSGEILGPYGLSILLISWLLYRSNRALFTTSALLTPFFIITAMAMGLGLFMDDTASYALPDYSLIGIVERLISYPFGMLTSLLFYPIIIIILLGVWAGRKGFLLQPEKHRKFLTVVSIVGILVSVAGAIPVALIGGEVWSPDPMVGGVLFGVQILTGVFGGIGYAALFGLFSIPLSKKPGMITRALAAAGKRSLTCYILQSTIIAIILSEPLLGLGGMVHATGAALIAIFAWLIGVLFSIVLEKRGQKGPLDALLRRLIHSRKRQEQEKGLCR